jgi:hypothetical protein
MHCSLQPLMLNRLRSGFAHRHRCSELKVTKQTIQLTGI